jgi:hypothetical protein
LAPCHDGVSWNIDLMTGIIVVDLLHNFDLGTAASFSHWAYAQQGPSAMRTRRIPTDFAVIRG